MMNRDVHDADSHSKFLASRRLLGSRLIGLLATLCLVSAVGGALGSPLLVTRATLGMSISGPSFRDASRSRPTLIEDVPSCVTQLVEVPEMQTIELRANCVTDRSILVEDGWTFTGNGHTIFAIDSTSQQFKGGVIDTSDATVTVRDVSIDGTHLEKSCAEDVKVAGVALRRAGGTIEDVTLINVTRDQGRGCGYAIVAVGRTREPVVVRNLTVQDSFVADILVLGSAIQVTGTTNIEPGGTRIVLDGAASSGTIAGNVVSEIVIENGASATIEDNHLSGSFAGIWVVGTGSRATIIGNTIESTLWDGIYVADDGSAIIRDNRITNVPDNGMLISGTGTLEITGNVIQSPGLSGIAVRGPDSHGIVSHNLIQKSGTEGISVTSGVTVSDNKIRGVGGQGIVVRKGEMPGAVTDNTIVEPRVQAIQIAEQAVADVAGNTITLLPAYQTSEGRAIAIQMDPGAAGRVSNNTIFIGGFRIFASGCVVDRMDRRWVGNDGNRFLATGWEVTDCEDADSSPPQNRPAATPST